MRGEDVPKTTFWTRYRHYEFLVMFFGLTNALIAFMDLMNRVSQNYLDSFVIVFIDEILVYSKNKGDHMGYLRVVLQTLKEHQLFSKYSKCEFWLGSVAFLRHIVSSEGFEVDPTEMEAVKNWPRLSTHTVSRPKPGCDWHPHLPSYVSEPTNLTLTFQYNINRK